VWVGCTNVSDDRQTDRQTTDRQTDGRRHISLTIKMKRKILISIGLFIRSVSKHHICFQVTWNYAARKYNFEALQLSKIVGGRSLSIGLLLQNGGFLTVVHWVKSDSAEWVSFRPPSNVYLSKVACFKAQCSLLVHLHGTCFPTSKTFSRRNDETFAWLGQPVLQAVIIIGRVCYLIYVPMRHYVSTTSGDLVVCFHTAVCLSC